jgi:hypothetical protein
MPRGTYGNFRAAETFSAAASKGWVTGAQEALPAPEPREDHDP